MNFRHQILEFLSTLLLASSLGNLNLVSAETRAPFLGNRTHLAYSSASRNGSATADPLFMTKATGRVLVGFGDLVDGEGEGLDVAGGRGDLIQHWAKENDIQVNISSKPRNDGMRHESLFERKGCRLSLSHYLSLIYLSRRNAHGNSMLESYRRL